MEQLKQLRQQLNAAMHRRDISTALQVADKICSYTTATEQDYEMVLSMYSQTTHYDNLKSATKLAIHAFPSNASFYYTYYQALRFFRETESAKNALQEAIRLAPNQAEWQLDLGNWYREHGEFDAAIKVFERVIKTTPHLYKTYWYLSSIQPILNSDALALLKKMFAQENVNQSDAKTYIGYALFNHYHAQQAHEKAFHYLTVAAEHRKSLAPFNINKERADTNALLDIFNKSYIKSNLPAVDLKTDSKPIFICGLPRSGTTLCEQILSSHSEVTGGDEIFAFSEAVASIVEENNVTSPYPALFKELDKGHYHEIAQNYLYRTTYLQNTPLFTDKMLLNYKVVGAILLAFQQSKLVFCTRDPMDTLFACYRQILGSGNQYSYCLDQMSDMIVMYHQLLKHWQKLFPQRVFHLQYEQLVEHPERTIKALVASAELDWQTQCLHFYENERPVHTLSNTQVRKPINKQHVASWKCYQKQLQKYHEKFVEKGLYTF
ncbi:tetratricopeptide repeat-containing sulfotransferase family protein [Thalassotalea agarivorans]|uniref:Tetratricopeptide repeat-containing protein n=1 Tax=Thalassotalea agarivorans TaxID=349064 RepID=A0A1I0HUC3_THASX|nr:sulfotransferase [Thalassotalea agarivorans]SET87656.1 Tetratricopeptide repeat-containing protein [Thalassotalea agarivorans]